jgi:hypothetical protein
MTADPWFNAAAIVFFAALLGLVAIAQASLYP